MTRPLAIEVMSIPSIIGISCNPEAVGLSPFTTWRKIGRYVIEPNMARPTIRPTELAIANVPLRNKLSGKIGSWARASAATNANRPMSPTAMNPRVTGDAQGRVVPPRLVNRMIAVSATDKIVAPR